MKKLLFIIIIGLFMSSCSTYTSISNGKGCGVWYPKKYNGAAPKMRSGARLTSMY